MKGSAGYSWDFDFVAGGELDGTGRDGMGIIYHFLGEKDDEVFFFLFGIFLGDGHTCPSQQVGIPRAKGWPAGRRPASHSRHTPQQPQPLPRASAETTSSPANSLALAVLMRILHPLPQFVERAEVIGVMNVHRLADEQAPGKRPAD